MKPQHKPMKRFNDGVTLVEILVTVVIISVGLLGVAALHTISLRNGQYAHSRSQASAFANDIIDRMRANRDVAGTAAYDIALGTPAPSSPTTLVQSDLKAWKDAIKAALPNGDGSVEKGEAGGHVIYVVTIQWGEHQDELQFTTRAAL
jgi:type IV pilus assembly protein PilV